MLPLSFDQQLLFFHDANLGFGFDHQRINVGDEGAPIWLEVAVPRLHLVGEVAARLRGERSRLARAPIDHIAAVLARVARNWLDPYNRYRIAAEQLLPAITGLSHLMVI